MPAWVIAIWDSVRSGIWFVPTVALIAAVTAAVVMPRVDQTIAVADVRGFSWIETSAESARSTLVSISSALITMASVVFSVAMVTLSLTTSQFGSRLLRTFLDSNATQVTLGVFLGASAYCLLVLQSITTKEDQTFVPHFSVGLAVASTVLAMGVFVYFMHHVATSIQAQSVVRAVADDLNDAIDVVFPERIGDHPEPDHNAPANLPDFTAEDAIAVESHAEGYLQAIDGDALLEAARAHDVVLRLAYQPGQFVVHSTPLAHVAPAGNCDEELAEKVRSSFITGIRRTPRQDVECAIDELVEVAVRALSPGINDPFTAVACIDYLGAALRRLATRSTPQPMRYDSDGALRVVATPITFADAMESAFVPIREYGRDSTIVHARLLQSLEIVANEVQNPDAAGCVREHAEMVLRSARKNLPEQNDVARIEDYHDRVVRVIESGSQEPRPAE
ncbi:MAG: DUF2254 domain-containing protein [Planctomycetota bacterium]|nr:MAG: DUF2254 domain-containing protein [Planctomycetota bacterium]REJ86614.1 MAG: DUF2254 domain-containing protein [Planctomycetota bacterium]REK28467.1 MAG: DUF2254 domain-containing protein [Planctomycetota bacterium]REK29114.1 MAG: DUF2254 domain-containing protein [Planctomycetota bacterium]